MEWISIKAYVPEQRSMVAVFHHGIIETKMYESGTFYSGEIRNHIPLGAVSNVTHWMYIPKRPERLNPEGIAAAGAGSDVCDSLSSEHK